MGDREIKFERIPWFIKGQQEGSGGEVNLKNLRTQIT